MSTDPVFSDHQRFEPFAVKSDSNASLAEAKMQKATREIASANRNRFIESAPIFKEAYEEFKKAKNLYDKSNRDPTKKIEADKAYAAGEKKYWRAHDIYMVEIAEQDMWDRDDAAGKPVKRNDATFNAAQISALKEEFSKIKKIDPASSTYKQLIKMLNAMDQPTLKQLASEKIPFVSGLALNRVKAESKPAKRNDAETKDSANKFSEDFWKKSQEFKNEADKWNTKNSTVAKALAKSCNECAKLYREASDDMGRASKEYAEGDTSTAQQSFKRAKNIADKAKSVEALIGRVSRST
jgi:hypothetical protein